jgi:hypothetical protein
MSFFKEFVAFVFARKKFWLLPSLILMAILGGLTVALHGSAIAPFIYTLF